MYYYVYKITNLVNGKFYIGKRKSACPESDTYMGSGKLITAAIKKYGRNNFVKVVIEIFDNNNAAANLEKKLVTNNFIKSNECYNMHEGGHGGFKHINELPIEERVNIKAFRNKLKAGEISVGGNRSMFFTSESLNKIKEGSKRGNIALKTRSIEEKQITAYKISEKVSGKGNSQYGKRSFTNLETGSTKKFIPEFAPSDWILTKEFEEKRMLNSNALRWYNDGIKNYYLILSNPLIKNLNLIKGRIRRR